MNFFGKKYFLFLRLFCLIMFIISLPYTVLSNVDKAYLHLYEIMDKYHNSFDVYTDINSGGNHFYPTGWMAESQNDFKYLTINEGYTNDCYSGTSCIEIEFKTNEIKRNWIGIYWQEPENNWGNIKNGGYNLQGAAYLEFKAKGKKGNEEIKFFMGGINSGQYNDSVAQQSTGFIKLTDNWKTYKINLKNCDLTHIIGGFGFETNAVKNPEGATFYLDEIKYKKSRLNELRFLRSFETISAFGKHDFVLTNVCYTYDNALALLAFLARGNDEDMKRAKILADTFCYVLENDRYYKDNRLRNGYRSGSIINKETKKANLPGWWDPLDKKWFEDKFNASSHCGNVAWAMLALISYYEKTNNTKYLHAVEKMAQWIENFKSEINEDYVYGGYYGGTEGFKDSVINVNYRSTEHNIDIYSCFDRLFNLTKKESYKKNALHALHFINKMWNDKDKHLWTGTFESSINKDPIPLDVHSWSVMAIPTDCKFRKGLKWVDEHCAISSDGFDGFDFDNHLDGVWFEGTAQMCTAFLINNDLEKYNRYNRTLEKAQVEAVNSNGKGIVAASHDGLKTGFDWEYFIRLHVGATAWYIFSKMSYNPYLGTKINANDNVCDNDLPAINFSYVPEYGDRIKDLTGNVYNVNYNDYHIAVFAYISNWWNKPYWNKKTVDIDSRGSWSADVTTGIYDYRSTRFTAFLLDKNFDPPLCRGDLSLPKELYENAAAHVTVMRLGVPENECKIDDQPSIEFTFVPKLKSFDNIVGRVCNASHENFRVVVYINVRNRWWIKPTFKNPITIIHEDGLFEADVTTGGLDSLADKFAAFLILSDYNPPLVGNRRQLPEELFKHAIDFVIVER